MDNKINFIHNSKIDLTKWDNVISNAPNSRIYALSWYLDVLCPNWYAIIYGDYEYLMPVISTQKIGINYAYQPLFTQQHGIFPPAIPEITALFINTLKKQFRFFDISLNAFNLIDSEQLKCERRNNYLLSLNHTYKEISGSYSTNCKRNIKKGLSENSIFNNVSVNDFIKLKKGSNLKNTGKKALALLKLVMLHALEKKAGFIRGAYSKQNELTGAAFFLKHNDRIIYLNAVSSEAGKNDRAMYAIIDSLIREKAEKHLYLDFEGSNIESIARFFSGFGAQPETYLHIKYNNLPFFIKQFKR